jgi:hypothetical protein
MAMVMMAAGGLALQGGLQFGGQFARTDFTVAVGVQRVEGAR